MKTKHFTRLMTILTAALIPGTAPCQDMPDWQGSVLDWVAAGLDTHYYTSTNSSTLSWGETYILQTYNLMHKTDGDTLWLNKLAHHGLTMISNARDVPEGVPYDSAYADGFRGWGTATYSQTQEYEEWLVHDGHYCTELARFIRTVYEDEGLHTAFLARADTLLRFLEKHVVGKWYSVWNTSRSEDGGTYHTFVGRENMLGIPINHFAAFGNFLLQLSRIAESPHYQPFDEAYAAWYRVTAEDLARLWKSNIHHDSKGDYYSWGYFYDGDNNDLSHAAIELDFALACYDAGVVFNQADMARFARTLTHLLWKKNTALENAEMWDFFTQEDSDNNVYDRWARVWPKLGMFDPLAWRVMAGVMRRYVEAPPFGGTVAAAAAGLAWVHAKGPLLAQAATYQVDDQETGDGDHHPDAGETWNLSAPVTNLSFETIDGLTLRVTATDPALRVIKGQIEFPVLAPLDTARAPNRLSFQVDPNVSESLVARIFLEYSAGSKTRVDSVELLIGPQATLLIDDDGGEEFEYYYRNEVLDSLDAYQYWDVAQLGNPGDAVSEFERVIWFTGNRTETSLTPDNRRALRSYLDNGGRLLLFSAGAERHLLDGPDPDSTFFTDYLHARPSDDSTSARYISVKTLDPAFFPLFLWILWKNGNDTFRGIEPAADATPIFAYAHSTAGIYTAVRHRVAYLTFGLEHTVVPPPGPPNPDRRRNLMAQLMSALDGAADISPPPVDAAPVEYGMRAFPNPFRGLLHIEVAMPRDEAGAVHVYNIQGQRVGEVRTGVDADVPWRGSWDGRDQWGRPLPAGVYFLRYESARGTFAQKVCLLP